MNASVAATEPHTLAADEEQAPASARSAPAPLSHPSKRWHEPGPPPLSARNSREVAITGALEEAPMAIVAGFDVHRAQITFDALNRETGEVHRGRIAADPESVRGWVG